MPLISEKSGFQDRLEIAPLISLTPFLEGLSNIPYLPLKMKCLSLLVLVTLLSPIGLAQDASRFEKESLTSGLSDPLQLRERDRQIVAFAGERGVTATPICISPSPSSLCDERLRCSLSQRERDGVRGNNACELLSASSQRKTRAHLNL